MKSKKPLSMKFGPLSQTPNGKQHTITKLLEAYTQRQNVCMLFAYLHTVSKSALYPLYKRIHSNWHDTCIKNGILLTLL